MAEPEYKFNYYALGNCCVHKDDAFKVGERVIHSLLGTATITKVIDDTISPDWVLAYMIYTDKEPEKSYNNGRHECLTFHNSLLKAG